MLDESYRLRKQCKYQALKQLEPPLKLQRTKHALNTIKARNKIIRCVEIIAYGTPCESLENGAEVICLDTSSFEVQI